MRSFYLLLSLLFVSCGSVDRPPAPVVPESEIPDRQLKEIVVYANYYPEEENRPSKYDPSMATRPFQYSSDHYCYNKKKEKEPVYDKSLKARLYDKNDKVISKNKKKIRFFSWVGGYFCCGGFHHREVHFPHPRIG